jgi:hypothetical protein
MLTFIMPMVVSETPHPDICLPQEQVRAIADALGDTDAGLTGSEIAHLLGTAQITDTDPSITKRHRLYNAFAHDQNRRGHRRNILQFIRVAMKPERFAREAHRFEPMRALLNRALAFAALEVEATGRLTRTEEKAYRRMPTRRSSGALWRPGSARGSGTIVFVRRVLPPISGTAALWNGPP